jgi:hypothetical protein
VSRDDYIVAGYYTPDYEGWASRLRASLHVHGQPYNLMPVAKAAGGWEANTLRKAEQVAIAMACHPDKVIIWLDVDCTVHGDLSPLAELWGVDVSVYLRGRRRWTGGYKLHARTGTIVFRPTPGARDFVAEWQRRCVAARFGDVDQTAFLLALGSSTSTSFQPLERKWCASTGEEGIIVHDRASRGVPKIGWLDKIKQPWRMERAA